MNAGVVGGGLVARQLRHPHIIPSCAQVAASYFSCGTSSSTPCLLGLLPSCHNHNKSRGLSTGPSFTTAPNGKVEYKMLSYRGALSLMLTGQPSPNLPPEVNVELDNFYAGTKRAIETISSKISTRDLSGLSHLVSSQCLLSLREQVFESVPATEIRGIALNADDIFFQYIESAEVKDEITRIKLVCLCLPQLEEAKQRGKSLKIFETDLLNSAKRNDGVLRRGDMNTRQYKKIQQQFHELNIEKLTKETDILVASYTFEREENKRDWRVSQLSHTNCRKIWSYPRRFIWTGRLHIAVKFDKDFSDILRMDYFFDAAFFLVAFLLQVLALYIGEKVEEERRRRDDAAARSRPMMMSRETI